MFRHFSLIVTMLLFAVLGLSLTAKPEEPKPASLPIKRIVLTNAGVGYYHREGTVNGNARVELKVGEEEVNDLILTLLAADAKGTHRSIAYDNRAPAEITLKAFRVDLTVNPTIGSLLAQVRGEKVEIALENQPSVVGSVVSVEVSADPQKRPEMVNLFGEDGLTTLPLAKLRKVKFLKPELQAEFKLALEALAAAKGMNQKTVAVTFHGQGERNVSLDYTSETPLWKPTYRLVLDGANANLQGLAAIENTSEEDWENVKITLASGRPITFKMDFYDPLFIPRPTVEPELYASLRPTIFQGQVTAAGFGGGFAGNLGGQLGMQGNVMANPMAGQGAGVLGATGNAQNLGAGGGVAGFNFNTRNPKLSFDDYQARLAEQAANKDAAGPPSLVNATNLGESFEYEIKDPVTLPRFKSALLPFMNEKLEIERVSVYNPEALKNYPQSGLYIRNRTKQFIAQGPITVYEGERALGQARLSDVKPGDSRLITYAIDLEVAMKESDDESESTAKSVTAENGAVTTTHTVKHSKKYAAVNRGDKPRTVWITKEKNPDWKLLAPEKPAETTANLYRFELKVPANQKAELEVIEESQSVQVLNIATLTIANIDGILRNPTLPAALKDALTKYRSKLVERDAMAVEIASEAAALKEIVEEQGRLRANLAAVPKESDVYKRYVKKFDDQETEIEKRRAKMKELEAARAKQAKEIAAMAEEIKG